MAKKSPVKGGAAFHIQPIRGAAYSVIVHDTRSHGEEVGPYHSLVEPKRGENYDVSTKYNFKNLEIGIRDFRAQRKALGKRGDTEAFHEGVLNLPQHADLKTGMRMAEQFAEEVKKKFGFRSIEGVAVHYDEGLKQDDGTIRWNKHAHIVFDRREIERDRMTRQTLGDIKKLQDIAAKVTGMPRGNSKSETGAKHVTHQEFKRVAEQYRIKERETLRAERRLTNAKDEAREANSSYFKAIGKYHESQKTIEDFKNENSELKSENKQLKDEIVNVQNSAILLHADNVSLKNQNSTLKSELVKSENARRTLLKSNEQLNIENKKFRQINEVLNGVNETLNTQLTKAQQWIRSTASDIAEGFKRGYAQVRDRLFERAKTHSDSRNDFKEIQEGYNKRIDFHVDEQEHEQIQKARESMKREKELEKQQDHHQEQEQPERPEQKEFLERMGVKKEHEERARDDHERTHERDDIELDR